MAKFTIKDLKEGRCAVYAGGDYNALCKVLKVAFNAKDIYDYDYYYWALISKNNKVTMGHSFYCEVIPTQRASDFLEEIEELENPKLPKRGDRILVWDEYEKCWVKRIFIGYIEGATKPVVCVLARDTDKFNNGESFDTCTWEKWKPIEKKVIKVTMQEIAEKYGVNEVQIVEKKG